MLKGYLTSGLLAATISFFGIRTAEKLEKTVAGGRALSMRGLMARHSVMAALMHQMKHRRAKTT